MMKLSSAYRRRKDACAVMRRLIKRTAGTLIDLQIDVCEVTVKMRKPVRCLRVWWPMLKMESWAQWMLRNKPQLLLGGQIPDPAGTWKDQYYNFWQSYQLIQPDHPVFSRDDIDKGACIPYFFHGDEGRGQHRRPYLVISWQCAIGHLGPQVTNDTSCHGISLS